MSLPAPRSAATHPRVASEDVEHLSLLDVLEVVDRVTDPCSESMRRPIGVVQMGLVRGVTVEGRRIALVINLTEPSCVFTFHIAEALERSLRDEFGPGVIVDVELSDVAADGLWTEERMTEQARVELARARRTDRQVDRSNRRAGG